jgi:hypothetical protein
MHLFKMIVVISSLGMGFSLYALYAAIKNKDYNGIYLGASLVALHSILLLSK